MGKVSLEGCALCEGELDVPPVPPFIRCKLLFIKEKSVIWGTGNVGEGGTQKQRNRHDKKYPPPCPVPRSPIYYFYLYI